MSPHLMFAGECEAAFRFYEKIFGATHLELVTYGAAHQEVPAEWREKVVHASLTIGEHVLAGADVPPHEYQTPQGFFVLMRVQDPARVFAELADGGEVKMPLQKTFWSPAFGVVVDRFKIPWEIQG